MIVDLLRNDLGKSCAVGSVRVPRLFAVESYATVHHLVSTVTGQLAPDKDALDLLRGCFPGGSITGAPKLRAMEIIEELEPHRRGVYCGAIGYVGFDGDMDLNVAIRTLTVSAGEARFYAGGGIVADSDPAAEYQETLDKAAAFFRALERCRDGGAAA
jgi:para-aminobenzoate synthetase component 1